MVCIPRSLVASVIALSAFTVPEFPQDTFERNSAPEASLTSSSAAAAAGPLQDWWSAVSADLAQREYHASISAAGLQAPNRAQNLRTYFRENTIEVVPRSSESGATWRFTWRTVRWGREGALQDVVVSGMPTACGSRVTYEPGALAEWYENREDGLEQGFTVRERPAGDGTLCIVGELGGELQPVLRAGEGAVDLLDAAGALALRYGALRVVDVQGREIPSHLELVGRELALVVEDDGADYPLTVDPLVTTPSWTVESDQASALLGYCVGTAGDVDGDGYSDVIVGASSYDNASANEGRAFVYLGSASGLSVTPAWTATSGQASALFGHSVSTAGDVNGDGYSDVVVGAYQYDGGESDEGRVYVYQGSSSGLSVSPAWTAECDQAGAWFGCCVGRAGDVNGDGYSDIIVGAYLYDDGETDEGRAYVYQGSSSGLSAVPSWTAEGDQAAADFGRSVDTAGDVDGDGYSDVIVGSHGRAVVYRGSPSGLAATPAWTAGQSGSFGYSVGTAGDVDGDGYSDVIVGAPWFDNGEFNEGRSFVYLGSSSGLAASPAWTGESNRAHAMFGYSVGTPGDVNGDGCADVIIGAPQYEDEWDRQVGAAFVYLGSSSGLGASPDWMAEGDQAGGGFARSVGTAGDVNGDAYSDIIVGAPYYDNGQVNEGRAFVFHGSSSGLAASPMWAAEGDQPSASFGDCMGTAGDVNGDGYSDVIVGAPSYDTGQPHAGRVFVYEGSSGGLGASPAWTAEGDQAESEFGHSVGTAGDVNGDGYSDVIVGAPFYDNGLTDAGRTYVYHGSPEGLDGVPAWTGEGDQASAGFGYSVGTAGDANGDGYSDVIVGAAYYDGGQTDEGRAYVYHGSSAGLARGPAWSAENDYAGACYGYSVATAGDVNGDGYTDVIVGAPYCGPFVPAEGCAYVYEGSSSGLSTHPSWSVESYALQALYGYSVGTAGDVNGDGYSDVIVGARDYVSGAMRQGRVFVYHGSSDGLGAGAAWTAESDQSFSRFGASVATAGDVNGDGYSDVVIGEEWYDGYTRADEGRALVYQGSSSGLAGDPVWTREGDQPSAWFGNAVGTAGDVNGDGYSDVIVAACAYDGAQADEGRAFAFYGNGRGGLTCIPRQRRTDGSAPISLLGRSDSDAAFRLEAPGRSPAGRGHVRLLYEIKPVAVPFDGTVLTGPWTDTGFPGAGGSVATLSELVGGLVPGGLYHWRIRILTDSPSFPCSRWLCLPGNAVTEADVRMAPPGTGVVETPDAPGPVWLEPAMPNPFDGTTCLTYALPRSGAVRVAVYDVAGRLVRDLAHGRQEAGRYPLVWDGCDNQGRCAESGVYFVRLEALGKVQTRRAVRLK